MSVEVRTPSLIASEETPHRARYVGDGMWDVSYLPGRTVNGKQAVSAVVLATQVARGGWVPGDPVWVVMEEMAGDLGLTAREVVVMLAGSCPPVPLRCVSNPLPRRRFRRLWWRS